MSNLSQILADSNWGQESARINQNFQNLNADLEKVKSATTKFKGYFTSETGLRSKYPSPQVGDTAWVGETYPGTVYDVQVAGSWHNTGKAPDTGSVDLQDYAKKAELTELEGQLGSLEGKVGGVGYVTCDTAAGTAAKEITVTGLSSLTTGIRLLVKMAYNNTASNATLNINGLGAKPLSYNNERVSGDNAWEAGEIVDIYYDGTNFYAGNFQGGSGKGGNLILMWNTDAATTRKQVKQSDRRSLLQISYKNSDGDIINEQYIGNNVSDSYWENDKNWVNIPSQDDISSIKDNITTINKNIGNIELQSGSFGKALLLSNNNNNPFCYLLKEEDIQKPIWHIGDGIFIDAVGAEVSFQINEWEIYNFTYKVKLTTQNETVYVPVSTQATGNYDMRIDWGDGKITEQHTSKTYKSCAHQYTGNVGDIFTIVLSGNIPMLDFSNAAAGGSSTLYEVINNTLRNEFNVKYFSCPNLRYLSSNAFNQVSELTSLNFGNDTSLEEIENGNFINIDKAKIIDVNFTKTNISYLADNFFEGMKLSSVLFRESNLGIIPKSLKNALVNVTNLYYAFYGIKSSLEIPSDLFDNISGKITDVRQCFAGSYTAISKITGDAEAIYNVLSNKIEGTNTGNCFSYNSMINLEKVPKSWGGKL